MNFKEIEKVKVTEGFDFLLLPKTTVLVTCLDENDNDRLGSVETPEYFEDKEFYNKFNEDLTQIMYACI